MAKLIPGLLQCAVAVMLFLLLVIMTLNHINIHIHITMETREPMHTTLQEDGIDKSGAWTGKSFHHLTDDNFGKALITLLKEQKMPILAPPTPSRSVFPTEVSRTMHTVTIRFRKNYFSDENGAVLGYSIIVAEDYTKTTEGDAFLPGWVDVQKYSTWPPFQVMEPYDPFNNNSIKVEDFTIGTDDCLNNHGKCNGKLKPGTIFRFKVRTGLYYYNYNITL